MPIRNGWSRGCGQDSNSTWSSRKSWYQSERTLGAKYANGEGVPENDIQAYTWFNIAAAQGQKSAEKSKKVVTKSMTSENRARAQELASEYWKAYVLPFRN